MKLVFFGSGTFGLPALKFLAKGPYQVAAVVTRKDRPRGRGLRIRESGIRTFAREQNWRILDFENPNLPPSMAALKEIGADLFLVISYGVIFSKELLEVPPRGAVNLHASLLPQYRGASPVEAAILAGERETGVTTIRMNEKLDAGDILAQEKTPIGENEETPELESRLAEIGAPLVGKTLQLLESGEASPQKQIDSLATYASKIRKEDGWIDWSRDARRLHNQIRAFCSWPGSKTKIGNREVIILKARALENSEDTRHCEEHSDEAISQKKILCEIASPADGGLAMTHVHGIPGAVLEADRVKGIRVACGKGSLRLELLKPEGKNAMSAREFLNGYPLKPGDILGKEKL